MSALRNYPTIAIEDLATTAFALVLPYLATIEAERMPQHQAHTFYRVPLGQSGVMAFMANFLLTKVMACAIGLAAYMQTQDRFCFGYGEVQHEYRDQLYLTTMKKIINQCQGLLHSERRKWQ